MIGSTTGSKPHVVIVGGGFGGLQAAKALADSDVSVTLVDRRNHHLFQPLLYQVATAALSPADIASPIRGLLHQQKNCRVVLGQATGVDLAKNELVFDEGAMPFDWLVLAAGARHSYFGNDHWEKFAPGLKSVEDATEIRRRILLAFENAEHEGDDASRKAALTFAIVGGGPTGVELAGAIKEIAAKTIPRDFRNIDTRTTRVLLFEASDRLLGAFDPKSSEQARKDLEQMGVEVRLNARITDIHEHSIEIGEETIQANNVFWAAGVQASRLTKTMEGVETDRAGRVIVEPDLSVPGHRNVFVVGDMAAAKSADTDKPVPGVAQGALQGGRHVGRIIAKELANPGVEIDRPGFVYKDKGSMATIGRARAVAEIGKRRMHGFIAWFLWCVIHVAFLVEFKNRAAVMLSWIWNWFVFARGARLITGDAKLTLKKIRKDEDVIPKDQT